MKKNNFNSLSYLEQDIEVDYTEEYQSDGVLAVAKDVCFTYLNTDEVKYSIPEIESLLELCEMIYVKHITLRENLKIKPLNNNYNLDIAKALDNITLGSTLFESNEITYYQLIAKDITSLCNELKFCILTLTKIIREHQEQEILDKELKQESYYFN